MRSGKHFFTLLAAVLLLAACGKSNRAIVRGTFNGVTDTPVTLSQAGISTLIRVDTVTTDARGDFRFEVELPDNQPAFYNLNCQDQTIVLLLAPGEQVEVRSLANLANNYLVEGSAGSQEVKELNQLLQTNRRSLDSLARIYQALPADSPEARKILSEYSQRYIRQKQEMIQFVMNHATSLSAIYALYQRMPNGEWFFGDPNDAIYFRTVADSLSSRYPASPHVLSLQRDIQQIDNNLSLHEMIDNAVASAVDYPDLELPDVLGERVRLSSLSGQVILVDFWVSTTEGSPVRNADLLEIYNARHAQGFEIYQIALDTEKLPWITAVQQQRLPWICVSDGKGADSPAVLLYNITQLPANVLINRAGEIVGRNLTPEQLEAQLGRLL